MITKARDTTKALLKIDFLRFCLVGGTGFVINFLLLTFFHRTLHVPTFVAQLISSEIALFSNFLLHNNWTYKHRHVKKSITNLLVQFHATSWIAIIGSAFMVSAGESLLHLSPLAALAVSSAIILLWNFFWSKFVIWRDVTPKQLKEDV